MPPRIRRVEGHDCGFFHKAGIQRKVAVAFVFGAKVVIERYEHHRIHEYYALGLSPHHGGIPAARKFQPGIAGAGENGAYSPGHGGCVGI